MQFKMTKLGETRILAQMTIFMALGILSLTPKANAFVCPNVTEVAPCDCSLNANQLLDLDCVGPDVTQDVLSRVLSAVRRENNGALDIDAFQLKFTNLIELDLTPFEGGKFSFFGVIANSLLSSVLGPDLSSIEWDPIVPDGLYWDNNNLQDESLQTMLSYFSRAEITYFSLGGNKLRGSLGQEFLPGFSELSGVTMLYLSNNSIRALGGGQFRGMGKLDYIEINDNGLEEVGEDTFLFDEPGSAFLILSMTGNNLTDESIHLSSGISTMDRLSVIFLYNNQFTKVRADQFEHFLEIYSYNSLYFEENPIWCDPEMKWLKDRREEFESKVSGLDCVNDPGQTAFTSSLVDG